MTPLKTARELIAKSKAATNDNWYVQACASNSGSGTGYFVRTDSMPKLPEGKNYHPTQKDVDGWAFINACKPSTIEQLAQSYIQAVEVIKESQETIHDEFCSQRHHPLCDPSRDFLRKIGESP